MWARPATLPWLLGYEIKMAWRGRTRGSKYSAIIIVALMVLLGASLGLPLALHLRTHRVTLTPVLVLLADIGFVTLFTLFLSQTLSGSVTAFYERGDLDLLLSSPLPPWRVLTMRALAVALMPMLLFTGLLTPFVVPAALLGHPAWLAAYGMLAALGFCAAAAGLVLAMALFAAIGARRTKTVGQLLAAFCGAAILLLSQGRNFFPHTGQDAIRAMTHAGAAGAFASHSLLAWPLRAAMGEPLPFIVLLGVSVLLFAAAAYGLGARFAANAAAAIGTEAPRRNRRTAATFRGGLYRIMIVKELRLLLRDPALLSQVFLRALYILPFCFVLVRDAHSHRASAVAIAAGVLAFLASQVSATLAWIAVSAEDAPDLIAAAPLARRRAEMAKLIAALIPVAVLVSAPLIFLIVMAPLTGVIASVGVLAVSLGTGALNLWHQRPGTRAKMRQRGSGALLVTIAEIALGILGGAATGLAAYGSLWSVLLIVLFGGALVLLYEGRPQRA